jgi:hypothetical protein
MWAAAVKTARLSALSTLGQEPMCRAHHNLEEYLQEDRGTDLGGEDQVLRALRGLVRLGYGVYGRAVASGLSGEPLLYSPAARGPSHADPPVERAL